MMHKIYFEPLLTRGSVWQGCKVKKDDAQSFSHAKPAAIQQTWVEM